MSSSIIPNPQITYGLLFNQGVCCDEKSKVEVLEDQALNCLKPAFKQIIGKLGKIRVAASKQSPSGFAYIITSNPKITYSEERTTFVVQEMLENFTFKFYKSGTINYLNSMNFEQYGDQIFVSFTGCKKMEVIKDLSETLYNYAKSKTNHLCFIQKIYKQRLIREYPSLNAAIKATKKTRGLPTIVEE